MSAQKPGIIHTLRAYSIPLIAGVITAVVLANIAPDALHSVVEFGPFDGLCADRPTGSFCIDASGHGAPAEGDGAQTEGDGDHAAASSAAAAQDGAEAAAALHDAAHAAGGAPHADDHGTMKPVFALLGHHVTLHFLINDIFMLFFFGVAAKEITESILPGGALNPPSKAVNPLLATIGGVLGPIAVYFGLTALLYDDPVTRAEVFNGWGIPTATDIALAWLVARVVFGGTHPAVNFLLLLAIADDAIGLVIIAIFYPNPDHPVQPAFLGLVLLGMAVAYGMRKKRVRSWVPYIAAGGLLSWLGLLNASLHPALALVPIVPFLPGPRRDTGLFVDAESAASGADDDHSTLHAFEHRLKGFVDFGLFFFGLANAGVAFATVTNVTWIVLAALIVGKMVGVTLFATVGNAVGFKFPTGMALRHIVVAGCVAGMGLTVALFVAGEAFPGESVHQGPAKMGALLSAGGAIIAIALGRLFDVKRLDT